MDCVCPHCGKKIKSGNYSFDLTKYIEEQLINATGFFKGITKEERMSVQGGIQSLFNSLNDCSLSVIPMEDRLVYSEEQIWNWPIRSSAPSRVVMMGMPYDKINSLFKKIPAGMNPGSENAARSWIEDNRDVLITMGFEFILEKQGHGAIRFDLIRSTYNQEPVVRERVCPECGRTLSFWAGRYDEICLGVLGGPRVSKSTTLTACASVFLRGFKGITWQGHMQDKQYKIFGRDYLEKYREGLPIDATEIGRDNIPRVSFFVTIRDQKTNLLRKELTLTFVDLPGEFNDEKGINAQLFSKYAHYFENVDFLWYCTDPGELLQVNVTADKSELVQELGYDKDKKILSTEEICTNMTLVSGLFNNKVRKVPVAYILGKTDASLISPEEKQQYHLYHPAAGANYASGQGPFDIRFFHGETLPVRQYMFLKNPILINTFERCFEDHCYFAISAYGFSPTKGSGKLHAFNVTVPFMWMLVLKSYYPITKVIRENRFGRVRSRKVVYYLNNDDVPNGEREKDLRNLFIKGLYLE